MKKSWEHSLHVNAPIDQVFALVSDFNEHVAWDRFTKKVELMSPGDDNGLGAEWRVYEQMGLFSLGQPDYDPKMMTGVAKRTVREVEHNKRIAWSTHPVPNVGINADISYDFEPDGEGTKLTFSSVVGVPGVVEKVGRLILRNIDGRQHSQWESSLNKLKFMAEEAHSHSLLAVGD